MKEIEKDTDEKNSENELDKNRPESQIQTVDVTVDILQENIDNEITTTIPPKNKHLDPLIPSPFKHMVLA